MQRNLAHDGQQETDMQCGFRATATMEAVRELSRLANEAT